MKENKFFQKIREMYNERQEEEAKKDEFLLKINEILNEISTKIEVFNDYLNSFTKEEMEECKYFLYSMVTTFQMTVDEFKAARKKTFHSKRCDELKELIHTFGQINEALEILNISWEFRETLKDIEIPQETIERIAQNYMKGSYLLFDSSFSQMNSKNRYKMIDARIELSKEELNDFEYAYLSFAIIPWECDPKLFDRISELTFELKEKIGKERYEEELDSFHEFCVDEAMNSPVTVREFVRDGQRLKEIYKKWKEKGKFEGEPHKIMQKAL